MPKTKAKPTAKPRERKSLMLDKEDYELLDEVRDANGWSVGEATRRAVHALFAYDAKLKAMAEQEDGGPQKVLQRIRKDVSPAFLIHLRAMAKVETDSGGSGIRVDDFTFFEEEDRLFARRVNGEQVEVYEVVDGRFVPRYQSGPEIVLNLN